MTSSVIDVEDNFQNHSNEFDEVKEIVSALEREGYKPQIQLRTSVK